MRLYRICRVDHLESYQGLGASYRDRGRWNEPGIPALYFAETASVAMLEMAHYLPSPRLVPPTVRLAVYEVADDPPTERWTVDDLPADRDRFPYGCGSFSSAVQKRPGGAPSSMARAT